MNGRNRQGFRPLSSLRCQAFDVSGATSSIDRPSPAKAPRTRALVRPGSAHDPRSAWRSGSFGEADESSQSFDEPILLAFRKLIVTGCGDKRLQFGTAWSALADLAGPHGDARRFSGAGRALVDDRAGERNDLVHWSVIV